MKTILVVDDEFGIVDGLALLFEDEGYTVLTAVNGAQAFVRIGERRPDLIVLDMMMPVMDGEEALRLLKADPALKEIPVVVASAIDLDVTRRRMPGAAAYFRKPFSIDALLEKVSELLGAGKPH